MAGNKRTPPLLVDEVLLLVDAYFQTKRMPSPKQRQELIRDLSEHMRSLPLYPGERENPAFRSYSGMQMCLSKVSGIDPEGGNGFGDGSALQKRVFSYYYDRQELLHGIADGIKSVSTLEFPLLPEFKDSIAGQILPSYHVYLERTTKNILNVQKLQRARGNTRCSICGTDLQDLYGEHATDMIEAHLGMPITELNGLQSIVSSSVMMVCPTCHKLAHWEPYLFEGKNLREAVRK